MLSDHLKQTIKWIFLPSLLLSILLFGSKTFFHLSENALLGSQLGLAQIPLLKISAIIPKIALALVICIAAIFKPFETVFRGILITLIGGMMCLTVLMQFQEHLLWNGVSEGFGAYKPLFMYWPRSLSYIFLTLFSSSLYSLLIWGLINRLISLSEGVKYSIPFALIIQIAGDGISKLGVTLIGSSQPSFLTMAVAGVSLSICALFLFDAFWKRSPHHLIDPQEPPSSLSRFPFLSAAYLLAGAGMAHTFLDILFKSGAKARWPDVPSYAQFMSAYSTTVSGATLGVSAIWAILGTWLIVKKGWKATALYASLSILVGSIMFLCAPFSSLVQGAFMGLLIGTSNSLFFPLVQLLYLHLPCQNRFKTKVVTEMIALPFIQATSPITVQKLIIGLGSIASAAMYLKGLFLLSVALFFLASCKASPKSASR